jgi:hypothetical protein
MNTLQEYYDTLEKQKQLVLQLRGGSVTEDNQNEENKTTKTYNAVRRVLGQPLIQESEPRHYPTDPLTVTLRGTSTHNIKLHGASANDKAASDKTRKSYELMHIITRAR